MVDKKVADLLYEAGDLLMTSKETVYMDNMDIRMKDGKVTFELINQEMTAFKKGSIGIIIRYFASMLEE